MSSRSESGRGNWRRSDSSIGYGRQTIEAADIEAVQKVLQGNWLTQGPAIAEFEGALAQATSAEQVVAVSSGTAALHLALLSLGIDRESVVVTSANTFLASATCALMCGARADFVDIDPRDGNLDPDALERRLDTGERVDLVVAVYFAGAACDLERLLDLKARFGFRLVIDACHALGGATELNGKALELGELPKVDAITLSFHPVKHITTGEGGAVLFSDSSTADRARSLREHGLQRGGDRLPFESSEAAPPWFAYVEQLGFNYRLNDLQAALGISQVARLASFTAARRRIASLYDEELAGCRKPSLSPGHAWHLYVVHVEAEQRDALMQYLREGGIGTQLHYYPVPLQPLFREPKASQRSLEAKFPNAVEHAKTAISLPIYPSLSDEDVGRVIQAFAEWRS